jgi:5-methylcytosine-specific restriction endonuclease McrA
LPLINAVLFASVFTFLVWLVIQKIKLSLKPNPWEPLKELRAENQKQRRSPQYKAWRMAVLTRDKFTCQKCGYKGGYLEAHHIKPFAYFPELRFTVSNGQTLCPNCHWETDGYGSKARKNYGKSLTTSI